MPKDASDFAEEDAYICTTLPLPQQPMKLVGVEPLARQEVVHHILLFGCSVPHVVPQGGAQPVWDCKRAPTCGSFEETILYGWGRNAPKLQLPDGVGFSVGGSSSIKYIVAQLHYLQPKPKGDASGVSLSLQQDPVPYSAGLLSFASWFTIPPRKKEHLVINSCCYRGFQPLTTFAVRVHTHGMGRSVFMARKQANGTGLDIVAKGDPLAPQGFNPVQRSIIHPGDPLTVTCVFDSSNVDHAVSAGPTHDHEMCNMYLMVYSAIPHIEMCNDGEGMVSDTQPGNMPRSGKFVSASPDSAWQPPSPTEEVKSGNGQGVLGDVTSVTLGPDGTLWVLHRGGATWGADTFDVATNKLKNPALIGVDVVLQMDPDTGAVLRRWGAGRFYMPHMVTVDPAGNVWVADVGAHQVHKFTPDGQLLLSVGRALEPGSGKDRLCKPSQVAFLRDGSFIVSDGYCNSRAARFTAAGAFLSEYGAAPGVGPMVVVHSVAADECAKRLYLADRENRRVVVLDLDTKELIQAADLSRFGRVWALRPGPYGRVLALTWEQGANASLVEVAEFDAAKPVAWQLPGTADLWPHDLALGAAPLALSGAGDRLFSAYIAPLCAGCGAARKYVLFPDGRAPPPQPAKPKGGKPVLAHLGGHHDEAAAAAPPAAAPAAAAPAGEAPTKAAAAAAPQAEPAVAEQERQVQERQQQQEAAAAAAKGASALVAAAPPPDQGPDEWDEEKQQGGVDDSEVHEVLHSRGAPREGFWLSAAQVAIASSVLAVFVGAAAYALVQRQRASGRGAGAAGGELARLNGGSPRRRGGAGALEGGGDWLNGGGGGGGLGTLDLEDGDDDLERLEREMLLRGDAARGSHAPRS